MKRIIIIAAVLFGVSFQAQAQDDINSQLANYFTYQNNNDDTAAFNLIKNVYFTIRDTRERDLTTLEKFVSTINSYSDFFTLCGPEEEEELGINTCARYEFQLNQVETVILPEAYSFRAEARLYSSDYLGALEDYDAAIKARPDNASYYTNRGNVKYKIKDDEGAIEDFKKSIALDSSNSSVYYNMGMVLMRSKDFTGAIQAFHGAYQRDPENIKALYYKGLSEYQAGLAEEALASFNAVTAADPSVDGAFFYSGIIHYKAKSFEDAMASFELATNADPSNGKAFYYLGISAFNIQDKDKACSAWNSAKELGYEKAEKMIGDHCGQ